MEVYDIPGIPTTGHTDIHVHVHLDGAAGDVAARLDRIEQLLTTIKKVEELLMSLSQQSLDLLSKLDAETTAISDRIDALLSNPSTTEAEFRAALGPLADRLDKLGHDPNNPVPSPLPTPPTP